ncbi:PhnA domain-containing protein [Sessilibacter sp. MAH2]
MTSVISRADGHCELCGAEQSLGVYAIPNSGDRDVEECGVAVCETCSELLGKDDPSADMNHWRCLQTSMWSPHAPVQVLVWRLLDQLSAEGWAQEALESMFMEDDTRQWAQSTGSVDADQPPTLDSNGAELKAGDTVVIIKDLDVKGTSFVAKRGTAVRNISLTNNPEHIEGRVNGTRIVLLTQYVKRSG